MNRNVSSQSRMAVLVVMLLLGEFHKTLREIPFHPIGEVMRRQLDAMMTVRVRRGGGLRCP